MDKRGSRLLKFCSTPIVFIIILIILVGLFIGYLTFYNIDSFKVTPPVNTLPEIADSDKFENSNIYSSKPESSLQECEADSSSQSCTIGAEEKSLPLMLKKEKTPEVTSTSSTKEYNSSSKISDQELSSRYLAAVNRYREYLFNIHILVVNFLQDKEYKYYVDQLSKGENIEFPPEIKNILTDLLNYNENYLLTNNFKTEKVFPIAPFAWLEKFIKIEKKPSATKDKEILRRKIVKKLDFFINFFWSPKLQQKFIEKNND